MVYVPEAYDPDVPAPLAYVFHGAGSNKEQQLLYSRYPPYADEDGALLVLPDALGTPMRWSPLGPRRRRRRGRRTTWRSSTTCPPPSTSSFCVDPERVLVTGMSSGGFMAGVGRLHALRRGRGGRTGDGHACGRSRSAVTRSPSPTPTSTAPTTRSCPYEGGGASSPGPVRRDEPGVGRPERLRRPSRPTSGSARRWCTGPGTAATRAPTSTPSKAVATPGPGSIGGRAPRPHHRRHRRHRDHLGRVPGDLARPSGSGRASAAASFSARATRRSSPSAGGHAPRSRRSGRATPSATAPTSARRSPPWRCGGTAAPARTARAAWR